MTNLASTTRSTEVDAFNRMLEHLQLVPVSAITNLLGDHALAFNKLVLVHRRTAARGWYCFNRLDRQTPTYDGILTAYIVPNALAVRTSDRLPCDPSYPQVRLDQAGRLIRMDTGSPVFTDDERALGLKVDITQALSLADAPEQYQAYVAAQAAVEIGAAFAVAVQPAVAQNALHELEMLEAAYLPKANAFYDDVNVLLTWAGR